MKQPVAFSRRASPTAAQASPTTEGGVPDAGQTLHRARGGRPCAPSQVLALQGVIGNRAVGGAFARTHAAAGGEAMRVGPANGPLEREADRAADTVMESFARASFAGDGEPPPSPAIRSHVAPPIARRCEGASGGIVVPDVIAGGIARARGQGRPLGEAVRAPLEQAFGTDLGDVRIHTGAQADGLSRSLAARAFTSGADVFFRGGAYDPTSRGGQHLLAHELAHVIQHGGASPTIHRREVGELPFATGYDKIVHHPEWREEAEGYEKRLGGYCYQHPRARRAADRALRRMKEVLTGYFTPSGKTEGDIAEAFLKNDTTSAGQVGTDRAIETLEAVFERGNLRERMTAFYNAAYYKAGYSRDAGVSLKTILHDITIGGARFDESASRALKLDVAGLRTQSEFLRGNARAGLHGLLARFKPDKTYTVEKDIFALGNLYYQYSSGWKNPFGALREMIGSQSPRIDRSRAEKATGAHKKTARDYASMDAPLSDREASFLAGQDKPLAMFEHAIDPTQVAGTHTDALGNQVTLGADGDPGWGDPVVELARGSTRVATRTYRTRDEDAGTGQEIEIRYTQDDPQEIEQVLFKQLILHPSRSRLEPGQAGPELPLDWIEGSAWFTFRDQPGGWAEKIRDQLGMPVVAGVSGTTTRMLSAFNWLNVPGVSPLDFRLAVMGWMLTSWDHSLYEILSGSRYAGVEGGTERIDNAPQMYQNIPPLTREELRAGPCEDRMFPHERLYMKMAQVQDDPDAQAPARDERLAEWTQEQYGERLIETGGGLVDEAHATYLELEDLARDAEDEARGRPRRARAERPGGSALKARLAEAGVDPRELVKTLSVAHIAALRAHSHLYAFIGDVMDRPRLLALRSIRARLGRHFRRKYLQLELAAVDTRLRSGVATRADRARRASLERKLEDIPILPHEGERIATYGLSALTSLAAEIAALPSGSGLRKTRRERLGALIDATAERLYEELQVHTNMIGEALDGVPMAAALALGESP